MALESLRERTGIFPPSHAELDRKIDSLSVRVERLTSSIMTSPDRLRVALINERIAVRARIVSLNAIKERRLRRR